MVKSNKTVAVLQRKFLLLHRWPEQISLLKKMYSIAISISIKIGALK